MVFTILETNFSYSSNVRKRNWTVIVMVSVTVGCAVFLILSQLGYLVCRKPKNVLSVRMNEMRQEATELRKKHPVPDNEYLTAGTMQKQTTPTDESKESQPNQENPPSVSILFKEMSGSQHLSRDRESREDLVAPAIYVRDPGQGNQHNLPDILSEEEKEEDY